MSDLAANAFVIVLLVGMGLVPVLSALATGQWRRTGWVVAAILGAPLAIIASLYLVGVPILLATFTIGFALARFQRLDHAVALAAALVCIVLIAIAVRETDNPMRTVTNGIVVSAFTVCTFACAAKLGRMAGRAHHRARQRRMSGYASQT